MPIHSALRFRARLAAIACAAAWLPFLPALGQSPPPDSIPITDCGAVITTPGNYHLTGDIGPCNSDAIAINASGVSLFLNGFTLSGPFTSATICNTPDNIVFPTGITISADASNVLITGGTITGFARGIILAGSDSEVNGVTLQGNCFVGVSVTGPNNVITSSVITGNHGDGVAVARTSGTIIEFNTVNDNAASGIALIQGADANAVRNNTALGNGVVDLSDANPNCGANTWTDNSFLTDAVAGVSDGGPETGCIANTPVTPVNATPWLIEQSSAAGPPYPMAPIAVRALTPATLLPLFVETTTVTEACTRQAPVEPCFPLSLLLETGCQRAQPTDPCSPLLRTSVRLANPEPPIGPITSMDMVVGLNFVPSNPITPILVPSNPVNPGLLPQQFQVVYTAFLPGQGMIQTTKTFAIGAGQPLGFANVQIGPPQSPSFHITFDLERAEGTLLDAPLFEITTQTEFTPLDACANASASPNLLWPPNHKMVRVALRPAPKSPGRLTILDVMQDEPVFGTDREDVPGPDAVIESRADCDVLWLRAERAERGNGRVYHVTFLNDDGTGNACLNTVKVSVPKDRRTAAIDDGPVFDSTKSAPKPLKRPRHK